MAPAMTAEERIIFLSAAIQVETEGSENWLALIEIFTAEAYIAAAELAVAESASEVVH